MKSPEGTASYTLDGEQGTILRVAPDFKSREIVATGIRFPVAMRFNRSAICSAPIRKAPPGWPTAIRSTSCLHVEQGRHYGFPPRHPRHLPNVIDEPSVFDYRPQHQSTCGLNFNEPTIDGTTFGPDWWRGDALVTGYSRGKLYRTKLVHTASGYVAQNQLIGTMRHDAGRRVRGAQIDRSSSPRTAAVPIGAAGPAARANSTRCVTPTRAPRRSLVWAQSPHEVHIAFDRPVDPQR